MEVEDRTGHVTWMHVCLFRLVRIGNPTSWNGKYSRMDLRSNPGTDISLQVQFVTADSGEGMSEEPEILGNVGRPARMSTIKNHVASTKRREHREM